MASVDAAAVSMASVDAAAVTRLILASASVARRRVLIDAGVDPIVVVSGVDEEAMTASLGDLPPSELALTLARAKARDVQARVHTRDVQARVHTRDVQARVSTGDEQARDPDEQQAEADGWRLALGSHAALEDDHVIVGCDSVFELDGIAYGKPLTAEVAIERITAMSGRTGHLHTGHWVIRADRQAGRTTTTTVEFAQMRADEIASYVATGEPLHVAGAFTLDGRAGP